MLSSRKNKADGTSRQNRELSKLRRQDLLELLLDQMHESDDLRATIGQQQLRIAELEGLTERLKDKLDLKDEQIEHLKDKLNAKDEQIEHLKGKLNDKDELIERLKKRLDIKDIMIAELMAQGRELPHSDDLLDMGELLAVEERAVESYLDHAAAANQAKAKAEAASEEETEAETDAAVEEEPAADEVEAEETAETVEADEAPAEDAAESEAAETEETDE